VWKSKSKRKTSKKKITKKQVSATPTACQMETFAPKQEDIDGFFSNTG